MIHLFTGSAPAGANRVSTAKCGETEKHGRTDPAGTMTSWWTEVDCPVCRRAGEHSVRFAAEQAAAAAAAVVSEADVAVAPPEQVEQPGTAPVPAGDGQLTL